MFEQVVPINKERHARTRVRLSSDFRFASKFHLAYLTMAEFVRAASTYPVVFLEDAPNNEFRPVALLGLELGENLFVASGIGGETVEKIVVRVLPFVFVSSIAVFCIAFFPQLSLWLPRLMGY